MQNHANALKAMLLYINDTWKYLQNQDEVQQALQSGTATKTELLAAGYNSNPYKGPGSTTVAPGDFSTTHVGDDTDTSPFPDPKLMGISTEAYIRNMGVLIKALAGSR